MNTVTALAEFYHSDKHHDQKQLGVNLSQLIIPHHSGSGMEVGRN